MYSVQVTERIRYGRVKIEANSLHEASMLYRDAIIVHGEGEVVAGVSFEFDTYELQGEEK